MKGACEGIAEGKGDIVRLKGTPYYRLKIEHYRAVFTRDKITGNIMIEELNTRTNIKYLRWQ